MDNEIFKAIIQYKRPALDFCTQYSYKMFSKENHDIAKAIIDYVNLYKEKPSERVLLESYNTSPSLQNKIKELFIICKEKYNEDEYKYDLNKFINLYAKRELESLSDDLKCHKDNVPEAVRQIKTHLGAIKLSEGQQAYERKVVRDHVDDFRKFYIEKTKNPDLGKGIMTGYSFLDYIKNGLRPADLIIIAGQTGSGKSILMNNMAIQIWLQGNTLDTPINDWGKGCNVTYFSLEMPYDDCFQRTMAAIADVPSYHIRDATLSRAEATAVKHACKFMKEYPYEFDIVDVPRGFTVEQLEMMFEEIKAQYIPDVVFIDYMGLMEDVGNGEDWLKLGQLAGKIHEFARAYSIPVVTAVQLNRLSPQDSKSESKSIGLHRIGRSSLIATHATMIIQIETRENEPQYDDFIYHIIKNRYGESGKSHSIQKDLSRCKLTDMPYNHELDSDWTMGEDISADVSDILGSLE